MKQRLGIAATLLGRPRLIILDEPTNGLDPVGTVEMRTLLAFRPARSAIAELGAEGFTIFLSSHLLAEVEQVCDAVAIIQSGRTLVQGAVRDLLARGDQLRLRLAQQPRALAVLAAFPELQACPLDPHWIQLSADDRAAAQIVRALALADVEVYEVRRHRLTLEALFLDLTSQPQRAGPETPGAEDG